MMHQVFRRCPWCDDLCPVQQKYCRACAEKIGIPPSRNQAELLPDLFAKSTHAWEIHQPQAMNGGEPHV